MREVSIRLEMHLDKFNRQLLRQRINYRSCSSIARVSNNFHCCQLLSIDVAKQVINVGRPMIQHTQRTSLASISKPVNCNQIPDNMQTGITTDRPGPTANQLHTIIIHGVMAGSHHNAAIKAIMLRSEVYFLCTALTDMTD